MYLKTKKWCTTWELWVKFYLGQNEDCTPRGSISESSRRLLQSGSWGKSIHKFWWRGSSISWSTQFTKGFFFFFFLILFNLLQNEDTVYYSLFKREFKEQRHIDNKLFLQTGKNTPSKRQYSNVYSFGHWFALPLIKIIHVTISFQKLSFILEWAWGSGFY